ncbi:MAG: hypothetical protein KatS3mg087_0616 [Patescibacteria group bacterium]|nr:MAG: hypothetical protein KatS3mg087_0616 [Patescibacteria group bacterium]
MAKTRGPAEFTIITPALSLGALKTLVANFSTLQATATVIKSSDQLDAATVTINEMYESNMTQASMAPISKTKTGLEATAKISIAEDDIKLFAIATNATSYQGTGVGEPGGDPELIVVSDQPGLTTGSSELPYRTVVIRPYTGNTPDTNVRNWVIFWQAGAEAQAEQSYSLQNQRSYTITLTAYDPANTGWKVIRGNPAYLP